MRIHGHVPEIWSVSESECNSVRLRATYFYYVGTGKAMLRRTCLWLESDGNPISFSVEVMKECGNTKCLTSTQNTFDCGVN